MLAVTSIRELLSMGLFATPGQGTAAVAHLGRPDPCRRTTLYALAYIRNH